MKTLDFHIEWEEAPHVRSPILAATWARLEIRVDGRPITRFWSEPAKAMRAGVYGSVFPLAQWVARHFWHLLDEGIRMPEVLRGARRAHVQNRPWLERHNLVFSRDGMAYPDLSIYREDERVGLRWRRDPENVTTPGRFLDEGVAQFGRADAEAGLAELVESVLARTADFDDAEVIDLRSDWEAINTSNGAERDLCARLAELGLDPYAADPDESVEGILSVDLGMPVLAIRDLLAATGCDRLRADLDAARLLIAKLPPIGDGHAPAVEVVPYDPLPYQAGYRRAEAIRKQLGIPSTSRVDDLPTVLERLLGRVTQEWIPTGERPAIEGAIERNGACTLAAADRPQLAQRFLVARALHHWQFVTHGGSTLRLLTRANDWQQSASRAFAAELLAPAAALLERLKGESAWDLQDQLADEFQVSSMVIAHQLENHGLG